MDFVQKVCWFVHSLTEKLSLKSPFACKTLRNRCWSLPRQSKPLRKAPFWTPTITACWLSVALCTVCMPMLFARCSLSGVWQLVRSLTPNMVFTQVVTLCNPCSFFGTYNMLHEQLHPMGCLGCTLLSLIFSKSMTPFQGMLYETP